jgi:glucose-1-phosphate cytidylyltransferase
MKTVILCGGLGSRLAEETSLKPKPMVKIGSKPILWHIIKYYKSFGFKDFILATGYKSHVINKYFSQNKISGCNILVKYTGSNTLTGGRILRLKNIIKDDSFFVTYGDGLSNININKLYNFHKKKKATVTLSAVRPPVRFGELKIKKSGVVAEFKEKPQSSVNWISGGFFVMNKAVFKLLKNDNTILEKSPLENLCKNKKLLAFKHYGFWQCMDTMRDKKFLNKEWYDGKALWKKW